MTDLKETIVTAVKEDLAAIEAALEENLKPHFALVRETAGHLLFSGGKRFRPLLLVLSARLCGRSDPFVTRFSIIGEYLHAATLLHDDVVDGAAMRRGKEVASSVWDAATAVLTGDFLLARALSIAAESNRPDIIRVIAEITELMSQGEIQQLADKGNTGLTEETYREVIRCKTGALIEGSCRTGAMLADGNKAQCRALEAYGANVGLAFQMADDLLDFTADAAVLGKAPGADVREGKMTLPTIHARQQADAVDGTFIDRILASPDISADDFKQFVHLLEKYGSIDYTRRQAEEHVRRAKAELQSFSPSVTVETMNNIADYTLARKM